MDNDYIQHYGILGQKWGVRRYQNKDGTLTPAGKRHLASLDAEREKLESKRKELDKKYYRVTGKPVNSEPQVPVKRKIGDISDDELRDKLVRLRMENQYKEEYRKAHPKKESLGKKYIDGLKDNAVKELSSYTVSLGMSYLKKKIEKMMKEKDKDKDKEES